ncbi:hypothetical protein PHLCEN_2v8974 [Hermanssonia centrifuga]|uniref:Uncharacterized protein n=1 Tax=Hermanssonia centrifuga TaxID=98765 RepID=A0A2R6NS43_9APHY|nr:hypothetical protein PHLCEN_2v8974 [Hermanssonia centrifuga]
MFFRTFFASLSVVAALCGVLVQTAPLEFNKRQIGDLQCNVNRVQIVSDIAQMKQTVNALATQVASDPVSSAAVSSAQAGISSAESAIGGIALSIITGQTAPAADRTQVESGLTAVGAGLGNITSHIAIIEGTTCRTDPAVTANVQKAQQQLASATTAGDGVLANCN